MWCLKCDKELSQCVCTDLGERIERLKKAPTLMIDPRQVEKYETEARRNKEEEQRTE